MLLNFIRLKRDIVEEPDVGIAKFTELVVL